MANPLSSTYLLFIAVECLVFGFEAHALPYDRSFPSDCLAKPLKPQYGGGLVINPELNEGLKGWTNFGDAKIEHRVSSDGSKHIVASKRKQSFHSFSQIFKLEKGKHYVFSAWLRVSHGNADVAAIFKTETSYVTAGWARAQKGCWSMLKGGIVVNTSGPADLYFDTNNTKVDVWAASFSLQPFTTEEWISHQQQSIEEVRRTRVRFHAVDKQGGPIPNATVSIKQSRRNFPFGCAINKNILHNTRYQKWFLDRFKYTVFENELKWYSTEGSRGSVDYSVSDALFKFTQSHKITTRGHNVFWDDPKYQQYWVGGLSSNDLWAAARKRIKSVMRRYKGKFIHWDVVNENLHFDFLEKKLSNTSASSFFYQTAHQIDPKTTPFLNDFNIIEDSSDDAASAYKYLQKISQLRKDGYNGPLGIGLEGHFPCAEPNLAHIRTSIEKLASAKLPIWVTELDVQPGPNKASYLDQILNELYSNRAVDGIVVWAAWSPQGCYRMCLTDNNFENLPTGHVVDKFIGQLTPAADFDLSGTTDPKGVYETSLVHGEYNVQISHPNGRQISKSRRINAVPKQEMPDTYRFTIDGKS